MARDKLAARLLEETGSKAIARIRIPDTTRTDVDVISSLDKVHTIGNQILTTSAHRLAAFAVPTPVVNAWAGISAPAANQILNF